MRVDGVENRRKHSEPHGPGRKTRPAERGGTNISTRSASLKLRSQTDFAIVLHSIRLITVEKSPLHSIPLNERYCLFSSSRTAQGVR